MKMSGKGGEKKMRKLLLMSFISCMIALLPMLSMPVYAKPPISSIAASGTWKYTPRIIKMWDWGFLGDEVATWTGTFEGNSYDVFLVWFGPSGIEGDWYVIGKIYFEGTVDGKSGSLVMLFVGERPAGEEWYGHWMILRGKGDLANLRGYGTWWGPGAPGPGMEGPLEYSGKIYFMH